MTLPKKCSPQRVGLRLKDYYKNHAQFGKQKQLAQTIGISQGSLSDICSGNSHPSASTLARLAMYTDIDLYWLLTGDPDANRK